MYIKNPVRRAVAAAALATSAAIAVGAVGARADSSITPDSGSTDMATRRDAGDAPPGSGLAGEAGMGVTLARQYEVVDGDSFWGIAERQLPDDATAGDVSKVTTALIAHNAPRLGYGDPAMLRPGDVVDTGSAPPVPAAAQTAGPARDEATVAPAAHEVVAGDSYWAIAEAILGDEATPADVLEKTEALIALNSPRLGYEDSQMLHPGDVVYLEDPASTEVSIDRGPSAEAADPKVADKNRRSQRRAPLRCYPRCRRSRTDDCVELAASDPVPSSVRPVRLEAAGERVSSGASADPDQPATVGSGPDLVGDDQPAAAGNTWT